MFAVHNHRALLNRFQNGFYAQYVPVGSPTRANGQCLYCSNKSHSRKERRSDPDAGLMISMDLFLP